MGLHRVIDVSQMPSQAIVTANPATAGTTTLIAANAAASTGSIYITDVDVSNGPTAGFWQLARNNLSASNILINAMYIGVNSINTLDYQTAIKIPASSSLLFAATSCSNISINVSYFLAP